MSKKQKKHLIRILVAFAAYIAAIVASRLVALPPLVELLIFLAVYAIIGWDVLWKAVRNILRGKVFDEQFLMVIATVGAFLLGEYLEGVAVMMFYQVGEWFQSYAVGKSRRSIAAAMDIRPEYANRQLPDGTLEQVAPEDVIVGDTIIIKPGERVPLDGVVIEGLSSLNMAALTGESAPRDVEAGEELVSGSVNLTGTLIVQVSRPYAESTVARILDLVENSSAKKAKTENFITRFARYYTPAVCIAALALAVVPPLVTGQGFDIWVYRALTFLVISCPCALVISVPLSFFGGIGGASKQGVLIKGSNYLEMLAKVDTIVFDKTGTLTKGNFVVSEILPQNMGSAELLELAAHAEFFSTHPIAVSIQHAYGKPIDPARIDSNEELAGRGIKTRFDGRLVLAGNQKLMQEFGIEPAGDIPAGTVVHVAADGKYAGCLLVEDEVKPDAKEALAALKKQGIHQTVMLTGDSDEVGRKVAAQLGLDKVYTRLMPADKVERVEELMQQPGTGALAFVGDGINDAPVLARADLGIAMGGLGSDAAIEAADIVVMNDEPSKIPVVRGVAKKTLAIVKQNITFALGIKALVLILGALGYATMWAAVFADVGVSVLAILNAMRALRAPRSNP